MIFCAFDALDPVAIAVKAQDILSKGPGSTPGERRREYVVCSGLGQASNGKQHKGIMDHFF